MLASPEGHAADGLERLAGRCGSRRRRRTDGTGSGRGDAGSLPTLSLGASTLARLGSAFAASDFASPLASGFTRRRRSDLLDCIGLAASALSASVLAVSVRRFSLGGIAATLHLAVFGGSLEARPLGLGASSVSGFRLRAWRACRASAWRLACCRSRPAPGLRHPRSGVGRCAGLCQPLRIAAGTPALAFGRASPRRVRPGRLPSPARPAVAGGRSGRVDPALPSCRGSCWRPSAFSADPCLVTRVGGAVGNRKEASSEAISLPVV